MQKKNTDSTPLNIMITVNWSYNINIDIFYTLIYT